MNQLDKLARHREAILLAEMAGLLHNIGKLNPNFLKSTVSDESNAVRQLKKHSQFVDGYAFKRFAKPSEDILEPGVRTLLASKDKLGPGRLPGVSSSGDLERAQQKAAEVFNKFYRGNGPLSDEQTLALSQTIDICGEKWRLTDLLTLFWDEFFHKPDNNDYQRIYALDQWLASRPNGLPNLLIHAHGEMSGSEKYQLILDDDTGAIITKGVTQEESSFDNLRISTAFGYETEIAIWELRNKQRRIINKATTLSLNNPDWRLKFQAVLRHGLGDTQRPINEITLWDYASSIAALFKTSAAKSFLEGRVADANRMRWRLLGVRFNGLDYILQASRIADILGRQKKYQQSLDKICIALTQDTPVASLVYQDESGLFFVVPDSDNLKLEDLQNFIDKQLQKSQFEDLKPAISWSETPLRGKQLNLGQELKRQDNIPRPSIGPDKVKEWWGNHSRQICEVCGLRPVISRETSYCSECKKTRQDRMQTWLQRQQATIWLDEVADSNGRLALITGQFALNDWIDGTLVESLALGMDESSGKPVPKFASFPRIQRIWQTTQTFWQESQTHINQMLTDDRRRLIIRLANSPTLTPNQTYELDLRGQTRMSVLWDGKHLISIDNLSYTAVQLNIPPEKRRTPVDAALDVGIWLEANKQDGFQLFSDDEKNTQFDIQIANVDYQDTDYAPTIPILAEPRTFMALIPADRALDVVAAIKTKYEREMGKVRNRLPLHLGIVYFHRRTPLRAALDAGRRMFKYDLGKMKDEMWTVDSIYHNPTLPEGLTEGTQQFNCTIAVTLKNRDGRFLTWHVPAKMGDGQTDDKWYPYVFIRNDVSSRQCVFKALRPKSDGGSEECWLVHAGELQKGDQVYFTPATLDFQWLGSAGQRFEIAYDEQGRRRGHPLRPYLLDELTTIRQAWNFVAGKDGLTSNQIYALRDLVETKRESWQPTAKECEKDGMFWQFCRQAVANANWKQTPDKEKLEQLTGWLVSGLFSDVIHLYMGVMKQKPEREENDE